jgi:DNA (cytosine-5)-methyltransferase 1
LTSAAYYNERDRFAAAWLRELIKAGHIAPGEVDERPIQEVRPADVQGFTQAHFFAGIGVWSYALRAAGWPDDRGVWTGSCPCQPFSASGRRGGFADQRHLWPVWLPLIRECRPDVIFGEQVSSPDGLAWLDAVQAGLEEQDYAVGALDTCAASVGAPMDRQRLYFVADADGSRRKGPERQGQPSTASPGRTSARCQSVRSTRGPWPPGPRHVAHIPLLADGATGRVGRLRGYGNALCAPQAQAFIEAYLDVEAARAVSA